MCKFGSLVFLLLLCSAALASAQGSKNRTTKWQTLSGNEPLVVARGGFSGLFPDSSGIAYQFAGLVSLPNVLYWCDVQLTKDGAGICFPNLMIVNGSDISTFYPNKTSTYSVNGVSMTGWFPVDFTLNELTNVVLTQGIYSRTDKFDGYQILTVQDMVKQMSPPGLWLNIQHDAFFSLHNLSMRRFALSVFRSVIVNYMSSPEVNFLKSILNRKPSTTKLVFRFLGAAEVEPSTNQTYESLSKNLTFIKTFASGILVPKSYIWPVDASQYLMPHTSIVLDAHKEGLEIFASDFANDNSLAYNFSYDPVAEYLAFIDNGNFSVDGVISDFPVTPSEAIACFSHIGKNAPGQAKPLVISSKGSSGDFPGCTDSAYQRAISDGVDVLDCPVQMSKDGIPVCLGSINLIDSSTVLQSPFGNLTTSIPELGVVNGIFTFSLTWSEIQSLTPVISNPYANGYLLFRNPKHKNDGKFMTLSDFLALANNASSVSGVLISIEDAAYLAEKQGLGVTDAVLKTIKTSSLNSQTVKKIMVQSSNSSVLKKFKQESNYELVYKVDEIIRDADAVTITDIKKFANSVVISKASVFPDSQAYITSMTDIVQKLQGFKLAVYASLFRNEFVSQDWDFFSDATVEINNFVMAAGVDAVVTEFPGTAARYKRNRCFGLGNKTPNCMIPVQPGGLIQLMIPQNMPPAEAPNPVLTVPDVVEPPLPAVVELPPTSNPSNTNGSTAPSPTQPNRQPKVLACVIVSYLAVLLVTLALF
ncbi:glycerophosphodiester phosphodiesterase GDPDL3-like [Camellia sinensis]|uniref:glycerophosphodiester phosphodiesterase GDPDL3-like n=1 Tax=Camellia sinensis TaxID=4442 RepID=UPI00103692FF|nr:glycerophosphodiester phosphodiesterase GDPDL3-like [Camellia sinensis]